MKKIIFNIFAFISIFLIIAIFEFSLYPTETLKCDSQYKCNIIHKYYKVILVKQKFNLSHETIASYKYLYNRRHLYSGTYIMKIFIDSSSDKYFVTLHSDSRGDLEYRYGNFMKLFYEYLDKPYDGFEIES